jgi:hypothetical protein
VLAAARQIGEIERDQAPLMGPGSHAARGRFFPFVQFSPIA